MMIRYIIRGITLIVIVSILLGAFCVSSSATASVKAPDTSKADAVCLYNLNTNTILHSKNMHKKIFPAGAVKMMTGLLACEILSERLSERVGITDEMLSGSIGANVKLKSGMTVTVEDLLYGVLCGGGNDAATVLSRLCGEDFDGFVELMNKRALELGMLSTHFTNPTGIDDKNMYSTMSDVLTLAKAAQQNSLYMDVSSTVSYTYTPIGTSEEIKIHNRNALISTYYSGSYKNPYASGMISGNTDLGGYCVITFAQKKNTFYICAVMGAESDDNEIYSYAIANSLLSYAFDNYSYTMLSEKGKLVCDSEVRLALPSANDPTTAVSCVIRDDVYALVPNTIDVEKDIKYRYYLHYDTLTAPITAGTIVGGVDIIYDGETVATAFLVTDEDVEVSGILLALERAKQLFLGRAFWLSVINFVVLFGIYFYVSELRFRHKSADKIKYKNFY